MLRRNPLVPKTTAVAIPPKRGVAHPGLGVCMVPFYIIYSITIDSIPGGYGHAR